MPVCSYLVIPSAGAAQAVAGQLAALPGCDVAPAENRDILLLVTDSAGPEEERALQAAVGDVQGICSLVMVFGEIEPELAQ